MVHAGIRYIIEENICVIGADQQKRRNKFMKKIISVLLTAAVSLTLMFGGAASAFAADTSSSATSGTCGADARWSYDTAARVLTISGSGEIYDYSRWSVPWADYREEITKVVIGRGITRIGNHDFDICENIRTAQLPSTLTSIGSSAFGGGLEGDLVLPDSVKTIGYSAFFSCKNLTSLTCNAKTIGDMAFQDCGITKVSFGSSLQSIGGQAFFNCPIRDVTYDGTKAQWDAVSKGTLAFSSSITSAAYHFSSAGSSFADVRSTDYFAEAVRWAVENSVAAGVSSGIFAPNNSCTRAEVVTFMWRAAGSPSSGTYSGFSDVPSGRYYAEAVTWAVNNGIASGTDSRHFSPDRTCTRAEAVSLLWRSAGRPYAGYSGRFSDVSAGAYYASAVSWAVQNNVTSGTSPSSFSPDRTCTRAEIVTLLYRSK